MTDDGITPIPPTEVVEEPVIGQSVTYEASVPRWQLGLFEGSWYCVPKAEWGLFTQLQALGMEGYTAEFGSTPDWASYLIEGPGAIYFRDPELING